MIHALPLPTTLSAREHEILLRRASAADLPAVVELLESDPFARSRGDFAEAVPRSTYTRAFSEISEDARNDLLVIELAGRVVGCLQLTVLPSLARGGAPRLQPEGVRVAEEVQSAGIGSAVLRWVLDVASPALGVDRVQLTSGSRRTDARRFYERLGFTASHTGFKYRVSDGS